MPEELGPSLVSAEQPPRQPRKRRRKDAAAPFPLPDDLPPTTTDHTAALDEEEDHDQDEAPPLPTKGRRRMSPDFESPVDLPKKGETFWFWIANFGADDWPFLIAYLWRTDPVFDGKFGGRASNIRKITAPFDIESIKQWEGSGGYRIDLVGLDRITKKQQRIAQEFFEIVDPAFPPRLPPGAWLELPENQVKWGWVKDALRRKLLEETDGQSTSSPSTRNRDNPADTSAIIRETVAAMNTGKPPDLTPLLMKLLDPEHQFKLAERLKSPPPNAEMMQLFQIMLANERSRNEQLAAELAAMRSTQAAPQNKPSLEDELAQQVRIRQLVKQLAGKETASETGPWDKLVEGLASAIPTAIALFAQQAARAPQQQARPTPAATMPPTPAADLQTEPNEPQQDGGDMLALKYAAQLQQHQALLAEVLPIMVDHFKYSVGAPDQHPGEAFQEWFLARHEVAELKQLAKDLPPPVLVALIESTPQLAADLNPPEKVREFLDHLFDVPDDEDEQKGQQTK